MGKGESTSIDETLSNRAAQYGDFRSQGHLVQELKLDARNNHGWHNLQGDMKEAIDMIFHKIGRIINGNPYNKDSWTDIIGYARCVERHLTDEPR
jgi:hypothetical protein